MGDPWFPVWASLRVATAATALSLLFGGLLGWALWRYRFRGRSAAEALLLLPLFLPPTVLGYYLLLLIGARSPFGRAWEAVFGTPLVFTLKAAVLAACVSTVPLVARVVRGALAQTDREIEEAARLDGAGGWALLRHIVLPQLRAPLLAAGALSFARSVGDFGATLMVAGNIPGRTQTASIAIYDLLNAGKDSDALLLVVLVSLLCLVVLLLTGGKRLD